MRLMQLVGLRRLLPRAVRRSLHRPWNRLLALESGARERQFYREFIKPGDLVFDVGANIGGKTTAFLRLGARVVALEPNQECAQRIRAAHPVEAALGELIVEEIAVASREGSLEFTVFDDESAVSSGSAEFLASPAATGLGDGRKISVLATTLDHLIERHGMPHFIKIDVEGMDAEVLAGLHQRPRIASFEYNTVGSLWDITCECFREAERLGFTEANLTAFAEPRFLFGASMRLEAAMTELSALRRSGGDHWGDVVLR